ncbi:MAG: hypothetical protein PHO63_04270 [Bacilli bacterium]|nr:hypothetical protein [Bacilli bacterium]MDD4808783.1 hypothetical protein [Bacilli bacterium]
MAKSDDLKPLQKKKQRTNYPWIIKVTIMAFLISFSFSFISESVLTDASAVTGIILVLVFIFIGIIFDIIGVSVTSAEEKPFHSMSARKVQGADVAVSLVKNAEKVSSFCCDVVGDICGIISGSAGVVVAVSVSQKFGFDLFLTTLLVTAIIASLTIGGKAIGKGVAINKGNYILYEFAKVISYIYKGKK